MLSVSIFKTIIDCFPILLLLGCDSFYVLRGRVSEGEISCGKVVNANELRADSGIVVPKALVSIYIFQENRSWDNAWLARSLYSDSAENFSKLNVISPTGRIFAALVISKLGYKTDTIYL